MQLPPTARSRVPSRRGRGPLVLVALVASACHFERYTQAPLDPVAVLDERLEGRRAFAETRSAEDGLGLAEAAHWVEERSPRFREALAECAIAAASAEQRTPLPNPQLEFGPLVGVGPDVGPRRVVPLLSLSLELPWPGVREHQDDLLRARAEAARIDAAATLRALGLELREAFVQWVVADRSAGVQRRREEDTAGSLETLSALVDAGIATASEVASFRLVHLRESERRLAAEASVLEATGTLSALLAADPLSLPPPRAADLWALPDTPPALAELRARAAAENGELARLRAEYAVAECALRVEIDAQYPALSLGGGAEGDTSDRKTVLGLTLGIELPLFDRNQKGIAEAHARRESVRTHYEAAADRVLGALDLGVLAYSNAIRRRSLLAGEVAAAARQNWELARRALRAGDGSALAVLEALRELREVEEDVSRAEGEAYAAWSRLERAVGGPIVVPRQDEAEPPRSPEGERP